MKPTRGIIANNWTLKLFSLVAAVALWYYVYNVRENAAAFPHEAAVHAARNVPVAPADADPRDFLLYPSRVKVYYIRDARILKSRPVRLRAEVRVGDLGGNDRAMVPVAVVPAEGAIILRTDPEKVLAIRRTP